MAIKTNSFKPALSFPNRSIAQIYCSLEHQKLLLKHIHAALPDPIAQHALHCVVNGKKLLVYTDTASWASQLRFYNSAILAAIAPITEKSVTIMQIRITTGTFPYPTPGRIRKPIIPSMEKIELIRNNSFTIADEQLKRALLKLSATLNKLSALRCRSG